MKNKEEFKRRLKDSEFLKLFSGVSSPSEISRIAQQQGYDVTPEDVENTTLSDDILESVAGGKGDSNQVQPVNRLNYDPGMACNHNPSTKVDQLNNLTKDFPISTHPNLK